MILPNFRYTLFQLLLFFDIAEKGLHAYKVLSIKLLLSVDGNKNAVVCEKTADIAAAIVVNVCLGLFLAFSPGSRQEFQAVYLMCAFTAQRNTEEFILVLLLKRDMHLLPKFLFRL